MHVQPEEQRSAKRRDLHSVWTAHIKTLAKIVAGYIWQCCNNNSQ